MGMLNHLKRGSALLLCLLLWPIALADGFAAVTPGRTLQFPADYGAHPAYRTEWWYLTGWLTTPDQRQLGFQVTFFRSRTGLAENNPSRFAARQLLVAHAALSDPAQGHILHADKSARAGFDLAEASERDTDVHIDNWRLQRNADDSYHAAIPGSDFTLDLQIKPGAPLLLQGEQGYSRKGPGAAQASYYYSLPQLQVQGQVSRQGKTVKVTGRAWLDHEWSSEILDEKTSGWDWAGLNMDDGSALTLFRLRDPQGNSRWAGGSYRDAGGQLRILQASDLTFHPLRQWQSPHSSAKYPVEMEIHLAASAQMPARTLQLRPLLDDQEIDGRRSTGASYWEGASVVSESGKVVGRGYLELTGYLDKLRF